MRFDRKDTEQLAMTGLTVGAVMRETLGTTLAFVSWYLGEGADQIVICFDDPEDPAIEVLAEMPQVLCIPCTKGFWRGIGVRANARFPKRQNRAMQHIYRNLRGGWFLNVDGDELVHLTGRTLAEELADTPDHLRSVTLRPVETVQAKDAKGATPFKTAMSREATWDVYGDLAPMMLKRQGLSGHTIGKTANRVGIEDVIMRQHFLQAPDGSMVMDHVIGPEEGAHLLHFFDQGYEVWRAKLPWRLASSGFTARAKNILQPILDGKDPEPKLRDVYEGLHVFDAKRREVLAGHAALVEVELDVDQLVRQRFPGVLKSGETAVRYA